MTVRLLLLDTPPNEAVMFTLVFFVTDEVVIGNEAVFEPLVTMTEVGT